MMNFLAKDLAGIEARKPVGQSIQLEDNPSYELRQQWPGSLQADHWLSWSQSNVIQGEEPDGHVDGASTINFKNR